MHLLVHLLGPTPTTPGSVFGAGPGASVGTTNPGSVAQTVHRHGNKIEAPTQVRIQGIKRFKGPASISERPRSSQRSRISPRERPLSRAGEPGQGRGQPQKQTTKASRQGLPGLTEAKLFSLALHYLPFASHFPLSHFTLAVLFTLSFLFSSFSLAFCVLVCWIVCHDGST